MMGTRKSEDGWSYIIQSLFNNLKTTVNLNYARFGVLLQLILGFWSSMMLCYVAGNLTLPDISKEYRVSLF
jgi:hypothetical protein